MEAQAPGKTGSFFVNRDTSSLVRVKEVDESYAYLEVLWPAPASYSMPVSDYDSVFVRMFRPASEADLARLTDKGFRPPSNAPVDWR